MFDPKTRARAIVIAPAFVATAPAELVQSAALNAMANAVEALESPACDPFSEALLMQALRLIGQGLAQDLAADAAVRERLVVAALLCGRGTEQGGTGVASVLAHAIGKRTHVANGIVNAIVLPYTMRFNAPVTEARSGAVLEALAAVPTARSGQTSAARVEALLHSLTVPRARCTRSAWRRRISGRSPRPRCRTGRSAATPARSVTSTRCCRCSSRRGDPPTSSYFDSALMMSIMRSRRRVFLALHPGEHVARRVGDVAQRNDPTSPAG